MKTQTNKTETTYDLTLLSISEIAQMMIKHVKIHPWAKPYHTAMLGLTDLKDTYGVESARTIVLYFLSNARSMTGDFMRAAKKELNNRLSKEADDYGRHKN